MANHARASGTDYTIFIYPRLRTASKFSDFGNFLWFLLHSKTTLNVSIQQRVKQVNSFSIFVKVCRFNRFKPHVILNFLSGRAFLFYQNHFLSQNGRFGHKSALLIIIFSYTVSHVKSVTLQTVPLFEPEMSNAPPYARQIWNN